MFDISKEIYQQVNKRELFLFSKKSILELRKYSIRNEMSLDGFR